MSAAKNIGIGFIALLIPLAAEFHSPETGLGFNVLLYWPFDFAYILLVGFILLGSNYLLRESKSVFSSLATGSAFWLGWFVVSFLAVGQLHLSLGYRI